MEAGEERRRAAECQVALDGVKRACRVPFMWPGLLDLFIVVCNLSAGVVDEIVERGDSD